MNSENVPDCTPLIKTTGTSTDIKGVNVSTPIGVGVRGGEYKTEEKTLQAASDAAQQGDAKFTRLCRMLSSYSHDQEAFYRTRDQMFDLIAATTYVASAAAPLTGQSPPAQPTSVPTESTKAAKAAGTNPAKAVANPPAPVSSPPRSSAKPKTKQSAKKHEQTLKNAIARLEQAIRKPAPKP